MRGDASADASLASSLVDGELVVHSFTFIGFGELASTLAEGLAVRGVSDIRVYAPFRTDASLARAVDERLGRAGAKRAQTVADAVRDAEVVIAAVPASAAQAVADASASALARDALYVDVAPLVPARKREVAGRIDETGAAFVDAAVVGTAAADGFAVPILAAGPGAARFHAIARGLGMDVSLVDGPPGQAALVKLLRSVYLKARDALVLEMLLAARRVGVDDVILETFRGAGERAPFPELANRLVCGVAIHAERRADELESARDVLLDAGVEPVVASAAVARLRRLAALGLRSTFGGERPERLADVLAAIESRSPDDGLL